LFIYELLQTICDRKNHLFHKSNLSNQCRLIRKKNYLTNLKHKIACQTLKSWWCMRVTELDLTLTQSKDIDIGFGYWIQKNMKWSAKKKVLFTVHFPSSNNRHNVIFIQEYVIVLK